MQSIEELKFIPNTSVIKTERFETYWKVSLSNSEIIECKTLVNASGPFVLDVLKNICNVDTKKSLRLVQGSHIVVKKLYEGSQAYILQLQDRRIIFLIPYQNKYTLIGTTDKEVSSYLNPEITTKKKNI